MMGSWQSVDFRGTAVITRLRYFPLQIPAAQHIVEHPHPNSPAVFVFVLCRVAHVLEAPAATLCLRAVSVLVAAAAAVVTRVEFAQRESESEISFSYRVVK